VTSLLALFLVLPALAQEETPAVDLPPEPEHVELREEPPPARTPANVMMDALNSEDSAARARASAWEVQQGNDAALVNGLQADPFTQLVTARAALARGDKAAQTLVRAWLSSPAGDPAARARIAFDTADEQLLSAFETTHRGLYGSIVRYHLTQTGNLPEWLAEGGVNMGHEALILVGELQDPRLLEPARRGADRAEEEVEVYWDAALLSLGDSSASGRIKKALKGDPWQREDVVHAVLSMPDSRARTAMLKAASRGKDDAAEMARAVRSAAAEKLLKLPASPAAWEAWFDYSAPELHVLGVEDAIAHDSAVVRARGLLAAAEWDVAGFDELSHASLEEDNPLLRVAAAAYLLR